VRVVLLAAAASLVLHSCASRPARTVDVAQPHDELMTCPQLLSEISATRRMSIAYGTDNSQQSERNQLAMLGVFVNPMILMHADTGDAAARETSAYTARAAHLEKLSQKKECKND
jgi:type IV pilus biogenesis protein CpaD/CtpE